MAAVLALNLVLAVLVVAALLRLLSWAIISSRADQLQVRTDTRQPAPHPYARPHVSHPHWPTTHRSQQGAHTPVTD
jgi:hypothetical protein